MQTLSLWAYLFTGQLLRGQSFSNSPGVLLDIRGSNRDYNIIRHLWSSITYRTRVQRKSNYNRNHVCH